MSTTWQDLRYGFRMLRRSPGFAIAAIATLALGIGVNAAVFSLVSVLSLKPLPYDDPSRVAFVLGWDVESQDLRFSLRLADFRDLEREATSFSAMGAYRYVSATLAGGDRPERVQAYHVTPALFDLLGVQPAIGRVFDEAEARADRPSVALISHGLWQRRFGGDRSIVGRAITINGQPHEIVGVMPARFEFPVFNFKGDVWSAWQPRDGERGQSAATEGVTVVARLGPGVSYAQAQSEADVLMRTYADRYPETNRSLGVRVVEMGRLDDEQAGPAASILLVTVSLVLLLSCANVANLLLSRGATRHRELAVRAAVGASRLRIGRQLLAEGLLLALAGGAAGALLADAVLSALRASLPEMLLTTVPNIQELGVDRLTLAYTLVLSLGSSLVFGLVPAWRAARGQVQTGLQESAALGGSRGTRRLRSGLVVAEVALASLLMAAAGLLVRSYRELQQVSPGFDPTSVLTLAISLPDDAYATSDARRQFFETVLERIEPLPGVQSAGLVNVLPFSTYDRGTRMVIDGAPVPEPGREPAVSYRVASPRFHEALGIPLVEGRWFSPGDRADGMRVALVNRTLARRHFGASSPIGARVRLGPSATAPWLTIVGVIGDVRHSTLTDDPDPEIHLPLAQAAPSMMMLAARSAVPADDLVAAVRNVIAGIDPTQAIYHVKTLEDLVGDATLPQRTSATLMLAFGALALVLAAIGVYGVVAYGVSQQTREFGVRIALGATPRDLAALVLRGGLALIAAGMVLGLGGAMAVSQLLGSVLFGVSPLDPATYVTVAALLAVTGFIACAVPARRACGTTPVEALRAD
jgi:putative ABC transport system permease protein